MLQKQSYIRDDRHSREVQRVTSSRSRVLAKAEKEKETPLSCLTTVAYTNGTLYTVLLEPGINSLKKPLNGLLTPCLAFNHTDLFTSFGNPINSIIFVMFSLKCRYPNITTVLHEK